MSPNPYLHALAASLYIIGLVLLVGNVIEPVMSAKENILMPMMMLSLLVLSVSVMGYLFFYKPILLFIEGDKRGAVKFFLSTVASFALLTGLLIAVALYFSL